jgi:hypothetical protein
MASASGGGTGIGRGFAYNSLGGRNHCIFISPLVGEVAVRSTAGEGCFERLFAGEGAPNELNFLKGAPSPANSFVKSKLAYSRERGRGEGPNA